MNSICEKYPNVEVRITYGCATYCEKEYPIIVLDKIVVPTDKRKQGIGTDILEMVCQFADETNSVLMLSPSTSLGATSIARLKKFYRRFGLKGNQGKTKIYQFPNYGMYRFPQ
jgi:Predicted acyltransferase